MKTGFNLLALFATTALLFASCSGEKDDPVPAPGPGPEKPDQTTLKADFSFEANALEVAFTNKSEGAASYMWNFGDGNTSTEKDPVHTYAVAGEYSVKLTVANDDGDTKSKEAAVSVAGAAKAYFSFESQKDRSGKFGKIISFDATTSENAKSIVWDFGDGTTASDFKVDHEFPEFETYKVKATVTGPAGDSDIYEQDVEVIAYNELIKGGNMDEEDAKYWTFCDIFITDMDYATIIEGKYCWQPYFGYKETTPKGGAGGCLRLSPENQNHDFANNVVLYQELEVVEGDVIEFSAEMKWGEGNNDDGLLWFAVCDSVDDILKANACPDGSAIIEMYNYWNAAGVAVPAYDGNFSNEGGVLTDYGYSGDGSAKVTYTAAKTGTVVFAIDYRNVWGLTFGPETGDVLIDSVSAKIIL